MQELHTPRASWRWRDTYEADAADAAAADAADAAATPSLFGGFGVGGSVGQSAAQLPLGDALRLGAFNGRITACLRDGQPSRAVALFEEMGVRGVPRNSLSLALGAEAMARCGEWARPLEAIGLIRQHAAAAGASADAGAAPPPAALSAVPASALASAMRSCVVRREWRGALALLDPSGDAAVAVATAARGVAGGRASSGVGGGAGSGLPLAEAPRSLFFSDDELQAVAEAAVAAAAASADFCAAAADACVAAGEWSRASALCDSWRGGGGDAATNPLVLHAAMSAFEAGGQWENALATLEVLASHWAPPRLGSSPLASSVLGPLLAGDKRGAVAAHTARRRPPKPTPARNSTPTRAAKRHPLSLRRRRPREGARRVHRRRGLAARRGAARRARHRATRARHDGRARPRCVLIARRRRRLAGGARCGCPTDA